MPLKKPSPVLEVCFVGSELRPERISIATLSRTLSAIHRLAAGQEEEELEEDEDLTGTGALQLSMVKRGSAVYQFTGQSASGVIGRLRDLGKVLKRPGDPGAHEFALSPLETLSAIARRLDCSIVIRQPGKESPVLARIEPNTYESISESLLVSGETSITGEVKGVGGATEMRCRLRVPFQERLLYCKVEREEVARKLGDYLYQDVVVQGTASWYKGTWRMLTMSIRDAYQPKAGSLAEAVQAIRKAGGKDWDKIGDVASFLDEVSGSR